MSDRARDVHPFALYLLRGAYSRHVVDGQTRAEQHH